MINTPIQPLQEVKLSMTPYIQFFFHSFKYFFWHIEQYLKTFGVQGFHSYLEIVLMRDIVWNHLDL